MRNTREKCVSVCGAHDPSAPVAITIDCDRWAIDAAGIPFHWLCLMAACNWRKDLILRL